MVSAGRWAWRGLPALAGRWWPFGAALLRDGDYVLGWPRLALPALAAALALGTALGALHVGKPLFSGSLLLTAVLVGAGGLGGGFGFAAWTGFVVADALLYRIAQAHGAPVPTLFPAGVVLVDGLLFAGCVQLAPTAAWLRAGLVRLLPRGLVRDVAGAVTQAAVQGGLAWIWTLAVPVLIRPYAGWQGGYLSTEDVQPFQAHGTTVAVVAAVAGLVRGILEASAPARPAAVPRAARPRGALAWWASTLMRAAVMTFFLSGAIDTPFEAGLIALAIVVLFFLSSRLYASGNRAGALLVRIPLVLRLAAVVFVAYPIGQVLYPAVIAAEQTAPDLLGRAGTAYLPLLALSLVTLALTLLVVPETSRRAAPPSR